MTLPSLNNLLLGKKYIGIEHFSLENEEKMALLLIEKKKDELVIGQKDKKNYSEIISEKWDKKLPFYLIINTNQVIQKEISEIDSSDEKLLHKAFPNLAWNEFYYEIWRLKTKSFIAISRKNYVENLILTYKEQGISITGMSLGICSVSEITKYLEKSQLNTNHQSISLSDGDKILSANIPNLNMTYNVNGLNIRNSHILAFSGILRLLLNSNATSGNIIHHNERLYDDYNQKQFFSKAIQAFIGILLAILLVNFFIFNNYYEKSLEASEVLLQNNSSKEEIIKIKKRVDSKEQKLQGISMTSSNKCSVIINEITKQVPSSILLSELIYNPLEKKIKADELIAIQEKTITIFGTIISNEAFTRWIEQIEKLKFIDEVVITSFGKNETSETIFSIKLILKKDEAK